MELYRFLQEGAPEEIKGIVKMLALTGLASGVLLNLINTAAGLAFGEEPVRLQLFLLYAIALAIYYVGTKSSLVESNRLIERLLFDLRMRIFDRIRQAELDKVEVLARGDLYNKLSQETNHLSSTFPMLMSAVQQGIMLLACLVYVGFVSPTAMLMLMAVIALAGYHYFQIRHSLGQQLTSVIDAEGQMLDSMADMVDGFKEIRMSRARNQSVFKAFESIAGRVRRLIEGIGEEWMLMLMLANLYLYALLASVVFLLPQYSPSSGETVMKLTAAALFCYGPMATVVGVGPALMKANVSLRSIYALETQLSSIEIQEGEPGEALPHEFHKISYSALAYAYRGPEGKATFKCGPCDLEFERGQVVFITGGNGSGKSTLLKLLTGLYRPESGSVSIDGHLLGSERRPEFRELFSCVFADFHLFEKLYGLETIPEEKVRSVLDQVQLSHKVHYHQGGFSDRRLSTGQRKRLALATALLEDRPIYIFDEVTADQDGSFRDHFYHHLIPELSRRAKIVVAVTHDDRYWHLADRLLKLELGKMVKESVVNESLA